MKNKLINEVRKFQKIAGILKESQNLGEAIEYDTPNLDVRGVIEDEAELNDMFLQHEELDLPAGIETIEDLEEKLGEEFPLIFTFVIQGNFSDRDSVYDLKDGTIAYVEGYDGGIAIYKKDVLTKVINQLKQMGAKPYTS